MTRVALRSIRAHLGRFLMSVVAVLLGVAFVAGTFSLRAMLSSTFDSIVAASAQAEAYVRGERASESTGDPSTIGRERGVIPLGLEEQIGAVDGVRAVVPDLAGTVVLVGKDGTAVSGGGGAPSFALAYDPADTSITLIAGDAPVGAGEIVLETSTMEASGLAIGDTTSIVLGGVSQVRVVGEAEFGSASAGARFVLIDRAVAIDAFAPDGSVSGFSVYADEGIDEETLVATLSAALADQDGIEVATGEQVRDESKEQIDTILGFISTFLLVFAAISLFVGAFIIANTFQMIVRQRQREFAMLRAIGASPGQVFASILVQAVVVGLIGSAAGVGAGVALVAGLRLVLAQMGQELSGAIPLDASTVGISMTVGVAVSVVAAAIPARRAALTPPVEAMRDEVVVADRASRLRAVLGALLIAVGAAAVVASVVAELGSAGTVLGAGAAGIVLGVLLVSPTVVPAALRVLAAPVVAALRPLGALARGNVTRNPRRTASTAGALMIGMALVGAVSVLAASAAESTRSIVRNESTADFVLQSATFEVPKEIVAQVEALDGVVAADATHVGPLTVEGERTLVVGIPADMVGRTLSVEVVEGDLSGLGRGEVAVARDAAEEKGWAVGDVLTLTDGTQNLQVPIAAVIDSQVLDVDVTLPLDLYDTLVPATQDSIRTVLVATVEGTDPEQVRAELAEVAKPYLIISVLDNEEFADALADQVNQVLVILYALLGLSVVIAVLGIVNTLALSIAERTKEIGLLRAVGLGRAQLASVVTIESILTAVFGTVLGMLVGVGIASALPSVFADQGLDVLAVPWARLLGIVALSVVVGAVAAVGPAVRAARMDVLDAVSHE
ncbi:ABC transporter permease [Actinotalea sp.]|uniref:ABC transporter permease n=1 Tax=Actinotalea sp. TaxID=1872145 RepID=UPI00356AC28D